MSSEANRSDLNEQDPILTDRLSALEARLLAQEQAERAERKRAPLVALIALGGIGLAILAAVEHTAILAMLSAACALSLAGLNGKHLAIANTVCIAASLAIAFIFLPALHEMNDQAEEAATRFVATMTATDQFVMSQPEFPEFGDVYFMLTPVGADFGDDSAVLP